jgi:hypothetical protein
MNIDEMFGDGPYGLGKDQMVSHNPNPYFLLIVYTHAVSEGRTRKRTWSHKLCFEDNPEDNPKEAPGKGKGKG